MSTRLSSTKTRAALHTSARTSAQLLLVAVAVTAGLWLVGQMWSVVWPLVVGLLLTTLTWPPARFLRNRSWPPALAASVVTVFALVVAAGIVALIAVPVASESGTLADGVIAGVEQLRTWAAGPPLNIGDAEITKAMDAGIERLQNSLGSTVSTVATGVGTVVHGVVVAVIAVFLMFFFLKDGPRFLPWLTRQLPGRLAVDIPAVAERCWDTLG
ncbi:AI-2E family transporter, partial [Streptomyces albidoflavus]